MIPRNHRSDRFGVVRTVIFCLSLMLCGAARAAADAVGEVTLAIGVSRLIGADEHSSPVARGMPVHVGDRIETEQGGHVHLRFVDGAFVSVRPGSRLFIETYRYDPSRPQDSAIRFRLEQGVARSISGKGAEIARERFRLNTPIAAIGVRGTDFVVQADTNRVLVAINAGAISLTPLGEGCTADAQGACSTSGTRTLSTEMGKVMLEFQRQQAAPRLVPINGALTPDRVNPPVPDEPRGDARASKAPGERSAEVVSAITVAAVREEAQQQATAVPPVTTPPPVTPPPVTPPPVTPPPVILPPVILPPVILPPVILPPAPMPAATLIWGRWSTQAWAGDTISVAYAEARAGRQATVGNDYVALFRPEPAIPFLVSTFGKVDFTLRDAQVHFVQGDIASLGRVDSAWLSVDFPASKFATGISMSYPSVGSASLQAAGSVRDDGIFAVNNADGRVAGALSLDGKEAGYFFERPVTGGMFVGTTRWIK